MKLLDLTAAGPQGGLNYHGHYVDAQRIASDLRLRDSSPAFLIEVVGSNEYGLLALAFVSVSPRKSYTLFVMLLIRFSACGWQVGPFFRISALASTLRDYVVVEPLTSLIGLARNDGADCEQISWDASPLGDGFCF